MKKFLLTSAILFLVGCSAPTLETTTHNAVIPLGTHEVGVWIPDGWERITPPESNDTIVLLARNKTESIAVSWETSENLIDGNALCAGAKSGFNPFSEVFVSDTECWFIGHPAPHTPLRSFWQKIVREPNTQNFLLASCSIEQSVSDSTQCSNILESFKILDKKE